ncbi:MAG: iron ABC transporter permease [Acidobacteriota bacterium]|nr:iron ABC transporter permease [Acidobacteriota bacterium]
MSARGAWLTGLLLLLLLAGVMLAGIALGGAPGFGPLRALATLLGRPETGPEGRILSALVFDIRLPRVVLLALAGAAFAAAGAALQAVLDNPLADPGLLGLSGGASLGAVLAYATGAYALWSASVPLAAFLGALVAVLVVYLVAHAAGPPGTFALLLTGVAMASLLGAAVSFLLVSFGDYRVHEVFAWLLGSAENRTWAHVRMAVGPVLAGIAGLVLFARTIDGLALGEEHAQGIGIDLARSRLLVMGLAALAAGGAVSVVGPVGFVGLMVPHLVRSVVGAAARRLLPLVAVAGAAFLVACDLCSRLLSRTTEVPVGIVTSLVGVVFFLVLLHRLRRA